MVYRGPLHRHSPLMLQPTSLLPPIQDSSSALLWAFSVRLIQLSPSQVECRCPASHVCMSLDMRPQALFQKVALIAYHLRYRLVFHVDFLSEFEAQNHLETPIHFLQPHQSCPDQWKCTYWSSDSWNLQKSWNHVKMLLTSNFRSFLYKPRP